MSRSTTEIFCAVCRAEASYEIVQLHHRWYFGLALVAEVCVSWTCLIYILFRASAISGLGMDIMEESESLQVGNVRFLELLCRP